MKDGVQSGLPENPLVEAVVVAVELKRAVGGGGERRRNNPIGSRLIHRNNRFNSMESSPHLSLFLLLLPPDIHTIKFSSPTSGFSLSVSLYKSLSMVATRNMGSDENATLYSADCTDP